MNWEERLKRQARNMLKKTFEEQAKIKKRRQEDLAYYIEEIKSVKNGLRKELFSGRPVRSTAISREDIINLNIALNISRSLEEFVEAV